MTPSVQPPSPPAHHSISRRRFLRFGALAAAVSCVPCPALALERTTQKFERFLDFYNVNTGESLRTVYWLKGKYLPLSLRDINYVLRDHHSDQVKPIDPQLLDLLYTIDKIVGLRDSSMCAFLDKTSRWCAAWPQICSGVVSDIIPGRVLCILIRDLYVPGRLSLLGYRQRALRMSGVVQSGCVVRLLNGSFPPSSCPIRAGAGVPHRSDRQLPCLSCSETARYQLLPE